MEKQEFKSLILPALFLLIVLGACEIYFKGGLTSSSVISLICDELTAYLTYYFFVYRKGRGNVAIWINYVLWTAFWVFYTVGNHLGWYMK